MSTPIPPAPVTPDSPRRLPLALLIIGGLVGVLLIGAGGAALAFSLLNQRPSSIPELLAADTQLYAAITPNLSDLPNIERLRRAFPETFDYQNNDTTADELEELLGVSMAEDVMPWLGGEVGVAVSGLPLAELAVIGADPTEAEGLDDAQVAFILTARDKERASAFLDKQRAHREGKGEQFSSSEAGGVTIYAGDGEEPSPLAAFALVRDVVVFASDPALIAAMAARDRDGPGTLQSSPRFQAVQAAMPADRLGFVYISGAAFADLVRASGEQAEATMAGAGGQQLADATALAEAMHGVGFSLAVIAEGVRLDATTAVDRAALSGELLERLAAQTSPVAAERSGQVSDAALGALSFRIPATLGESVQQAIDSIPEGAEQLAQYEEALGLSLQDDLLAWFHGEAVLALFPDQGELPVAGYFALAPADRAAAERGVEKIVSALSEMAGGELGLAPAELGGASYQTMEMPTGVAGYGFVGDDLVIGYGRVALEAAAGGSAVLADEAGYKAAIGALPAPNSGLFYIDLPAALELARASGELDEELAERLAPFRALAGAGSPGLDERGVASGSLLVLIGDE